ncbi:hypothetical protein EK904_000192 [Melospiza melodia maxima]|nr:hypothetical protein EK904_000192 [Melospiza melodia maxima]
MTVITSWQNSNEFIIYRQVSEHIFLNSIIIKQVKTSDTEWLCSGWCCQKAVAEGVGLAELFASRCLQQGSDSLVEPSLCAAEAN